MRQLMFGANRVVERKRTETSSVPIGAHAECPLWVKLGRAPNESARQLKTRKRTRTRPVGMSVQGQKQTFVVYQPPTVPTFTSNCPLFSAAFVKDPGHGCLRVSRRIQSIRCG